MWINVNLVYRSILNLLLLFKIPKISSNRCMEKLFKVYDIEEFDNSEKCLWWPIEMLQLDEQEYVNKKNWIIDELIRCVDLFADLYSQQKKFELALLLYLGILKILQAKKIKIQM